MEGIDKFGGASAEADVCATFRRQPAEAGAQIDPELRISLTEADSGRADFQFGYPNRGEYRFIKTRCCGNVADCNGDMVDHAGAPDFMSLKMMESIKA